jgi:hypothetical protein
MASPPPHLPLCVLIAIGFAVALASSPFDAALSQLQARIGYDFRAPDLLRRAMTHASYSRENGRALAVLGLAASQSAAALRALANDYDAAALAVPAGPRPRPCARRPATASASQPSCASPPGPTRPRAPSCAGRCALSSARSPWTQVAATPPARCTGSCTTSPPRRLCDVIEAGLFVVHQQCNAFFHNQLPITLVSTVLSLCVCVLPRCWPTATDCPM